MAEGGHQPSTELIKTNEEITLPLSIADIPNDSKKAVEFEISDDTPSNDTVPKKDGPAQRSKPMPGGSVNKNYGPNYQEEKSAVSEPSEGHGETPLLATKSQTDVSSSAAYGSLQDQQCGQTQTGTSYPNLQNKFKEDTPQHVSGKTQTLEQLGGGDGVSHAMSPKGSRRTGGSLDKKELETLHPYANSASKADDDLVTSQASQHSRTASQLNESGHSQETKTESGDKSFALESEENQASLLDTSSPSLPDTSSSSSSNTSSASSSDTSSASVSDTSSPSLPDTSSPSLSDTNSSSGSDTNSASSSNTSSASSSDTSSPSSSDTSSASSSDTSSPSVSDTSSPSVSDTSSPSLPDTNSASSSDTSSASPSGESLGSLFNDHQDSLTEESQVPVPSESQAFLSSEGQASHRTSASVSSASLRFERSARCVETGVPGTNPHAHNGVDSATSALQREYQRQRLVFLAEEESEDILEVISITVDHRARQQIMAARGDSGSESQHQGGARSGRRTVTSPRLGEHARLQFPLREDGEPQGLERPGAVDSADERREREVDWPLEINWLGDLQMVEMEDPLENEAAAQPVQNQNLDGLRHLYGEMSGADFLHYLITQELIPSLTERDGRDMTVCFVETCRRDQHLVFLFNCHHLVCMQCFRSTIPRCPFCGQLVYRFYCLNREEEEEEILVERRGIT